MNASNDKQSAVITVSFTPKDKDKVMAAAKKLGIKGATLVRLITMDAIKNKALTALEIPTLLPTQKAKRK